jgi:hypothetical protein
MEIVGKCIWGYKGKPIGKFISCAENREELTATFECDPNFLKQINKIITSKATDKKKIEKIQKLIGYLK